MLSSFVPFITESIERVGSNQGLCGHDDTTIYILNVPENLKAFYEKKSCCQLDSSQCIKRAHA